MATAITAQTSAQASPRLVCGAVGQDEQGKAERVLHTSRQAQATKRRQRLSRIRRIHRTLKLGHDIIGSPAASKAAGLRQRIVRATITSLDYFVAWRLGRVRTRTFIQKLGACQWISPITRACTKGTAKHACAGMPALPAVTFARQGSRSAARGRGHSRFQMRPMSICMRNRKL